MLISNPILGLEPTQLFEKERLDNLGGTYPVTSGLLWHGGVHVTFPATGGNQPRAIASGKVVAFRTPTVKPTSAEDLKAHPLNYQGWTDDGFVLLKHEKESGESTKVVFYSLYMHLSALGSEFIGNPGAVVPGGVLVVKRKQVLGKLGSIDGQNDRMHFEIFTDDASFKKFFKRGDQSYVVDANGNGEKDLWGDVHFVIPANTPYQLALPTPGTKDKPYAPIATPYRTAQELCVTVKYSKGDRIISTCTSGGELLGELKDTGAEYDIYSNAKDWFPKNISAGYELLRHGRVVGADPLPAIAPNWKKISIDYGRIGYIDLNQTSIKKLSDADFPPWKWKVLSEGNTAFSKDNKCDIVNLINEQLDPSDASLILPLQISDALTDADCKKKLQSLICQFPSEWDAADNDTGWAWVKTYFANPAVRAAEIAKQRVDWIVAAKSRAEGMLSVSEEMLVKVKEAATHSDLAPHIQKRDQSKQKLAALESKVKLIQQNKYKPAVPKRATDPKPPTKEEILADYEQQKTNINDAETEINNLAAINEQNIVAIKRLEKKIARLKSTIEAAPAAKQKADAELALAQAKVTTAKTPSQDEVNKAWSEFKAHLEALQWWGKIPGMPNSNVWHFHPMAFVKHFKKCHWLSVEDIKLVYFDSDDATLTTYCAALNAVMYKYGVVTSIRQACLLGQAAQETGSVSDSIVGDKPSSIKGFTSMLEASNAPYRDASKAAETNGFYNDPRDIYFTHIQNYDHMAGNILKEVLLDDNKVAVVISGTKEEKYAAALKINRTFSSVGDGVKFRGRGMKQLTGRYNYAMYWVYRGWLDADDFENPWWDTAAHKLDAPVINDPQRVGNNSFNCIDAGGWYWESRSINSTIGASEVPTPEIIKKVTLKVNGKATEDAPSYLKRRRAATLYIFKIFGDNV